MPSTQSNREAHHRGLARGESVFSRASASSVAIFIEEEVVVLFYPATFHIDRFMT